MHSKDGEVRDDVVLTLFERWVAKVAAARRALERRMKERGDGDERAECFRHFQGVKLGRRPSVYEKRGIVLFISCRKMSIKKW